jgi:WD40 repeat protein
MKSEENSIKIWNFESGLEIKTLNGHKETLTVVAISK